ncbi:MAG TPA: DUF4296 domain-containing protein [Sediminibacterium sp.]
MSKFRLVVILLFSLAACRSNSSNNGILVADTMKAVMWDMMRADEVYLRMTVKDSTAARRKENIRLYEQVFAIHGITKKQFDSSYRYYASHPSDFKRLLDSLDTYATRERSRLFEKKYGEPK